LTKKGVVRQAGKTHSRDSKKKNWNNGVRPNQGWVTKENRRGQTNGTSSKIRQRTLVGDNGRKWVPEKETRGAQGPCKPRKRGVGVKTL